MFGRKNSEQQEKGRGEGSGATLGGEMNDKGLKGIFELADILVLP